MVRQQAPPREAAGDADSDSHSAFATAPQSQSQSQSQLSQQMSMFSLDDDWFEDGMSPSQKSHSQPMAPPMSSQSPPTMRQPDPLVDRFRKLQTGQSAGGSSYSLSQPNLQTAGLESADSSVVEVSRPHQFREHVKDTIKDTIHRHNPFQQHHGGGGGGGHGQVMSSLKQKAAGVSSVFLQQKTRPEHHTVKPSGGSHSGYGHKVAVPSNAYAPATRAPAPPKMYGTMDEYEKPSGGFGESEFYTDPAKAAADLKALLEGGVEEEDKEAEEKDGTVEGLLVKLLPHQVEGAEWMQGRELGPVKRGKVPKGGILADDMGLGKTLQTIALILENQRPDKDGTGWKKAYTDVDKTTLVVAPLALIRQWEAEIKEKVAATHRMKVCVHHGPARTKDPKELSGYDVVITTYQTLVSEHGSSNMNVGGKRVACFGVRWWRIVLDEAHTIKNKSAKATKACCALDGVFRWCLTGTPMQNKLEELQSLIHFLRIQPYDDLREFKDHIEKPLNNGKGHIAIRRLHAVLRCFMKRRTKDILKKEGALNPGGKPSKPGEESTTGFRVVERKVVALQTDFSPAEKRFYERLESRTDQSIEKMLKNKVNYANALVLLLRLRQACNHPKLVEGKIEKDKDALTTDAPPRGGGGGGGGDSQGTSMDDLANMLAGTTIQAKSCNICGRDLDAKDFHNGRDQCKECFEDLNYFNSQESARDKKPMKKPKVKAKKELVTKQAAPVKNEKRGGGRKIIVDSDDEEEDEGSWLVPEDKRGKLKLGKAGGQSDEDAEGGGDWIGDEDSKHSSEDDSRSQLDSFVIPDDQVKEFPKPGDYPESDDDDFPSIAQIKSAPPKASKLDSSSGEDSSDGDDDDDDDDGISASELEDSAYDTGAPIPIFNAERRRYKTSSAPSVLASAKIRRLVKILHGEAREHKFIVFSQFTSMLDLVEPFLRKDGFRFTRYDGSMKNDEREASLARLRNDKNTRILLCSLKCGSLGLNLTAATRVVILEPFWNPFIEEQAIDRVHRLTQKTDVVVYKLTVKGTVEERILQLQDRKRQLAEQAIEGSMKKDTFKLGIREMLGLFRHDGSADFVSRWEDGSATGNGGGGGGGGVGPSMGLGAPVNGGTLRAGPGPAAKGKGDGGVYGRRW